MNSHRLAIHCRFIAHYPCIARRSFLSARLARNRAYNFCEKNYSTRVIRRSVDPANVIIALGFWLSLALVYTRLPIVSQDLEHSTKPDSSFESEEHIGMASPILPGRPGNLTKDQEAKLQEFWIATLKLFGVEKEDDQESQAGAATSEKKKKKRSMFSRKEGGQSNSSADKEDKYGQTKDFLQMVATQSPEDLRKAFWSMVKHDHPDGLLLRFLRARKWDIQNALVMLVSAMHWRLQEMNVDDDVMKNGESAAVVDSLNSANPAVRKEGNDFMTQLRMGKSFLHGTDREGRPMCFVRVRLHKQGEQSDASLERFTVYAIETARLLLESNVDTAAVVFDMTGFSMANMDYAPVKFMIRCFEANYPESLGVVLVHKSPWIFHGIWTIIKGWLDPVVAAKVHFTKTVDDLSEFISRDHILTELGGDDPWTYRYEEPIEGENERMNDASTRQRLQTERAALVREFEEVTREWIHGDRGEGAGEGKNRREELAKKLREGYWELDPYVRARSVYDRIGLIGEGGKIHFYDAQPPAAPPSITVQNGPLPAGPRADDLD